MVYDSDPIIMVAIFSIEDIDIQLLGEISAGIGKRTHYVDNVEFDLNSYKDYNGELTWNNGNNSYILNKPIETQGRVRNFSYFNGSIITQYFIPIGTASFVLYCRNCNSSNVWTPWQKILTESV